MKGCSQEASRRGPLTFRDIWPEFFLRMLVLALCLVFWFLATTCPNTVHRQVHDRQPPWTGKISLWQLLGLTKQEIHVETSLIMIVSFAGTRNYKARLNGETMRQWLEMLTIPVPYNVLAEDFVRNFPCFGV